MDDQYFRIDPELSGMIAGMSAEELLAFREMQIQQGILNDPQLELDILILLTLGGKLRSQEESQNATNEAFLRAESWAAEDKIDISERKRRMRVLNSVLAMKLHLDQREPISTRRFQPIENQIDHSRWERMLEAPEGQFELDQDLLAGTARDCQQLIETLPPNDPRRVSMAAALAMAKILQYNESRTQGDLESLLSAARLAVEITPPNNSNRARALDIFAQAMFFRWEKSETSDNLEDAITALEHAIPFAVDGIPRTLLAIKLCKVLEQQYGQTKSVVDFERGMELCNMLISSKTPRDHDYGEVFNRKAGLLTQRAIHTRTIEDMDAVVDLLQYGVRYIAHDHPARLGVVDSLARILEMRYQQTGDRSDIDRSVSLAEECLGCTSINDDMLLWHISSLVTSLGIRYQVLGDVKDIEQATEWADLGQYGSNMTNDQRALSLRNMGDVSVSCFRGTSDVDSLTRGIKYYQEALQVKPCHKPIQNRTKSSLASALGMRGEYTNSEEDVDLALRIDQESVNFGGGGDNPRQLLTVGLRYLGRYNRSNDMRHVDEAIKIFESIRDGTAGEKVIATALNYLGECWRIKEEIETAIEYHEMAIQMTPEGRFELPNRLACLAGGYEALFRRTDNIEMLNRAIELGERALSSPNMGDVLLNAEMSKRVGNYLSTRYSREGRPEDEARARSCFLKAWGDTKANPLTRLQAGRNAAGHLASFGSWKEASDIYQQCVEILPKINPVSVQNSDKQHILEQCSGMASDAAAVALMSGKNPEEALKVLELGRGLISGLLLQVRADNSALKLQYPDLAVRFEAARNALDLPLSSQVSAEMDLGQEGILLEIAKLRRNREVEESFAEVCNEIRQQPGFERFILPPTSEELKSAADQGPIIVINVSVWRCDAFIVENSEAPIRSINLPDLHLDMISRYKADLDHGTANKTMEFLWDAIASPVLEALGFHGKPTEDDRNWSRIWWIPTGPLITLPLHAAGYHTLGSDRTVLDRVISSYASSIKTIIYSRQRTPPAIPTRPPESTEEYEGNALLVSMQYTPFRPGESPISMLPYAQQEMREVADLLPGLKLRAVMPRKRRADCLAAIRQCRLFHFAGHGQMHPYDPSQSALLLEDWQTDLFTVADVRDSRMHESAPFLAYLSACSTGAALNVKLFDENIHLVGGFQLAGFRHVIGTLWEVADKYCVDVAMSFYKTLIEEGGMTDAAVSLALHRAIRKLRDNAREEEEMIEVEDYFLEPEHCHGRSAESHLGIPGLDHSSSEAARVRSLRDAEYGCGTLAELNPMYWAPYVHFGL